MSVKPTNKRSTTPTQRLCDFTLENHLSIVLMRPQTPGAVAWLALTAPEDALFFGQALVIEPRYVSDVAEAAIADGLTIAGGAA